MWFLLQDLSYLMIVHGHNILVLVSLVVPMIYPFDLERVHSIPLEYQIGT